MYQIERYRTVSKGINFKAEDIKLGSFFFCKIILVFIFLFVFSSACISEDSVEIRGISHILTPDANRVIIELSGPVEFTKGRLPSPERLYIDIRNAKIVKEIQRNYVIENSILKTIRVGVNGNIVRIVFDLNTEEYKFNFLNLQDPARLVVEFFQIPDQKNTKSKVLLPLIKRKVVIDPGHGGHDPGAVGRNGLYEKDVVLDIALKVRDIIIKEYPLCEVILTRDKDIFIPLDERAAIANRSSADLFVSIHVNASPNRKARGIETYILNWTDDEEAMRVAARENAISLKKMRQVQNELGVILASLEREAKRDESVKLASYVQNSLISEIKPKHPEVNNLGVKQALFYVLVGAKMPSILVETSFISNADEEILLADEAYRQRIARAIASGINSYFREIPQQRIASNVIDFENSFKPVGYSWQKDSFAR